MDTTIRELERQAAKGDEQAREQLARHRRRAGIDIDSMQIVIDGETYEVNSTREIGFGDLWELATDGGDFIVSEDSDSAGAAARAYWADMAENDPREFTCIVGEETLVQWGLGRSAGPGSRSVSSLEEWLDLWLSTPEEQWASYDCDEREVSEVGDDLTEELGYRPTVAYRCN